ncbi:MAG TPA: replication initiator protein A [Gemmatimonadaceae bacterium]|jgi:plasmid replication initiation protein|nr:replication initiator protein A [Gemmatimonadaceae bacterium]
MTYVARRRIATRAIVLDRSLESLPIFRLSDSAEDSAISFSPESGGRWRVLPNPGDRLPGTFDQDVYVELLHRYHEAGFPDDGVVTFTLHAFLRSIGRRVDGRTYEQLRSALTRLERTILESSGVYVAASEQQPLEGRFTILSSVSIARRRMAEREQFTLFPVLAASEPGDARVTIGPVIRANIAAGHTVTLSASHYLSLTNPVARRLYRLLEVAREDGMVTWRVPLASLAEQLPLTQRYPSHLQRVLQPAHEMLLAAGLLRDAAFRQINRDWLVDYVLASRAP